MGLERDGITILHFDETYFLQKKLQNFPHDAINFQEMKHVNLFCEKESLNKIRNILRRRQHKGVTLIGSGNYHYVTLLLLEEIQKPFTLLLFDNHPDLGTGVVQNGALLSCGSWVAFALRNLPLLKQVVIIGPTTILPHHFKIPRVSFFPFDRNCYDSMEKILSVIPTENLYISIDKDVLNKGDAVTNWSQGKMALDTLDRQLSFFLKMKNVEGVDICGEPSVKSNEWLQPKGQMALKKNEHANITLLETCLRNVIRIPQMS